jgi:membrane fusion protein (multidrug efflux system)
VPSVFLGALAPGLEVEARTPAFPDQLFRGAISSIDSRVDPVTRSVRVRALIDNAERLLRPGQLMTVELLRNPRQALMVPESALLHRGDAHFVFVVNGEPPAVEQRPVQIGARRPGEAEILDGLSEGARVVTHGLQKAKPGGRVEIITVDDGTRSLQEMLSTIAEKPGH